MVEVKPGMRGRFVESGELCAEFPYRAKALFAFEEIDGTDICFFGMHVQVSHQHQCQLLHKKYYTLLLWGLTECIFFLLYFEF